MTMTPVKENAAPGLFRLALDHWPPARAGRLGLEPTAGDGSDRLFFRLSAAGSTCIGVFGPDPRENIAYQGLGEHLWRLGEVGPEFLAADLRNGLFLVEDLGAVHLQDIARKNDPEELGRTYRRVLELLALLHESGLKNFDPAWCHQTARYDRDLILERETGYFIRTFVRGFLQMEGDFRPLDQEFERLAEKALADAETVLMHRDFQSRNVMIAAGRPRFLDFQGARPGPPGYDLASLVFDPYAALDDRTGRELLSWYMEIRAGSTGFNHEEFEASFYFLGACRLLQALGAYGFLAKEKKKMTFEKYMNPALRSLDALLSRRRFDFAPGLRDLIAACRAQREARP
ncbi:MAG: phosphotransferase [Pseudomonadota bacterium]